MAQHRPHEEIGEKGSKANDAGDIGLPLEPIDAGRPSSTAADERPRHEPDAAGEDAGTGGKLVGPKAGPGVIQPARLRCTACGYDMTGLTLAGRCPECGQTVQRSMREQAAAASELSGMAVASVVFGAIALGTAGCLAPVAFILGGMALQETKRGRTSKASRTLAQVGIGLGMLALVLGVLWIVAV